MTKQVAIAEKFALEKRITELDAAEARRKPTDPAIDIPLVRAALTDHETDERDAFERIAALVAFYENSLRPLVARVEKAEARAEKYRVALTFYADERIYFPRSLLLLANREGVSLAPIYSEFGETARAALAGEKE